MSTRRQLIERILRQVHGGYIRDDSEMTFNLVNNWLNDAIALAAKTNYTDSLKVDGVSYVNNSFYTRFKNLTVNKQGQFEYNIQLPQIPVGIGKNEGVNTVEFVLPDGSKSLPVIPISENQVGYHRSMRPIPNKIIGWPEGDKYNLISTLPLNTYPAEVSMISGGDSNNMDSNINVPEDYFPLMVEYIKSQLLLEKVQPKDQANDGADIK